MSYPPYDYTFEKYNVELQATRQYPLVGDNMIYPAMGVCGEAGELLDKIKKHWRNKSKHSPDNKLAVVDNMSSKSLSAEERTEIVKEVGDVLWYLNALAQELGTTLEYCARENVAKLLDRQARGTICSRGDNR